MHSLDIDRRRPSSKLQPRLWEWVVLPGTMTVSCPSWLRLASHCAANPLKSLSLTLGCLTLHNSYAKWVHSSFKSIQAISIIKQQIFAKFCFMFWENITENKILVGSCQILLCNCWHNFRNILKVATVGKDKWFGYKFSFNRWGNRGLVAGVWKNLAGESQVECLPLSACLCVTPICPSGSHSYITIMIFTRSVYCLVSIFF